MDLLDEATVVDALAGLPGWERRGNELVRTYTSADFRTAMELVNQVAELAEAAAHHPDIDIRWNQVTLTLSTHSAGGLTAADLDLAARIEEAAGRRA